MPHIGLRTAGPLLNSKVVTATELGVQQEPLAPLVTQAPGPAAAAAE